jgi:hypothetical protein
MFKTIAKFALGAMFLASSAALAATGIAPNPGNGPTVPDATWLNGVANGQNASYIYGLTATGSNQAGSLQLVPGNTLIEIDTVASSTGVALPPAVAGTEISIYNNGANTLAVYPSIANNGLTGAQDTINNGTSFSGGVATHTQIYCFSAKNGVWACK